jgi:hypothetical protein
LCVLGRYSTAWATPTVIHFSKTFFVLFFRQ